jgi:hypothetical protein
VRRQAQRDAALDSQMPQNVKKSKAPPLSAHSKFRGFPIDEEFFNTLSGFMLSATGNKPRRCAIFQRP